MMRRLDEAMSDLIARRRADGPDHLIDALRLRLAASEETVVLSGPHGDKGPRQTHRWRGPIIAATAVAVALLIAVPLLVFGGGNTDVADTTGDAVVTTTLASAPETTAAPSSTIAVAVFEEWQEVGSEVTAAVDGVFDLAPISSGLVATGFEFGDDDRPDAVILTSGDGETWNRSPAGVAALSEGSVFIYAITEGGPGLIAAGMGCEGAEGCLPYPTVWTWDGTAWTRSGGDVEIFGVSGAMLDVLDTGEGVIAVGHVGDVHEGEPAARPAVWRSADGTTWARSWTGDPIQSGGSLFLPGFEAASAGPDGTIVGVGTAEDREGRRVGAAWVSSDGGQSWERAGGGPARFGEGTALLDVAWGPAGFVAVGTVRGEAAAVWQSVDGSEWSRVDLNGQSFETVGSLGSVQAIDGGYLIAGPHGFIGPPTDQLSLWTSVDAATWDLVEVLGTGYAMAVTTTDRGIILGGGIRQADDRAAIWAGPEMDPADPPAPPTAETALPADPASQEYLVEPGRTCDELALAGAHYPQVASYLAYHGAELELDAGDRPCGDHYTEDEIGAVFGATDGLVVSLSYPDTDEEGLFEAAGPAVDAGLICSSGTVEEDEDNLPASPELVRLGGLHAGSQRYTCDDGSGSFVAMFTGFVDMGLVNPWPEDGDDGGFSGIWKVVEGTGAYSRLSGGGAFVFWERDWSWELEGAEEYQFVATGVVTSS